MYKTLICILSGLSSPIEATICLTCRLSISVLRRQMLPSAQNLGHRWSCPFSAHMETMQAAGPLCSCLCVICNQSLYHVSWVWINTPYSALAASAPLPWVNWSFTETLSPVEFFSLDSWDMTCYLTRKLWGQSGHWFLLSWPASLGPLGQHKGQAPQCSGPAALPLCTDLTHVGFASSGF